MNRPDDGPTPVNRPDDGPTPANRPGDGPTEGNRAAGAATMAHGFGRPLSLTAFTPADAAVFRTEMGRPARGVLAVAYRCAHGIPAVVQTAPRLDDGTPFPTMFYLCCSTLTAAVSRMESAGVMREMTARLALDPDLAAAYRRAHRAYLAVRNAVQDLGIDVSAGGMPDRVKCLHVLVAHALATGRGVNPLGDEATEALGEYLRGEPPCARVPDRPVVPTVSPR